MKIDSLSSQVTAVNTNGTASTKVTQLQREIQQTNNDLSQINKKMQLSDDEKKQKKEYEQKLQQLELKLQQAKQEKTKETKESQKADKNDNSKTGGEDDLNAAADAMEDTVPLQPGLGENVDVLL